MFNNKLKKSSVTTHDVKPLNYDKHIFHILVNGIIVGKGIGKAAWSSELDVSRIQTSLNNRMWHNHDELLINVTPDWYSELNIE